MSKKWKSLLFKASHLDLEYQERKELMDQNKHEFDRLVMQEIGTNAIKNPVQTVDEVDSESDLSSVKDLIRSDLEDVDDESSSNQEDLIEQSENEVENTTPDSINKLWKLIALKTHPDRNKNNQDYTKLYIEASDCYKEQNYGRLIVIALELGIAIPQDDNLSSYVKDNINALEAKIQHIETLALWQWINAEENEKPTIVKLTAEILKKKRMEAGII
jgi:hypothetical protein